MRTVAERPALAPTRVVLLILTSNLHLGHLYAGYYRASPGEDELDKIYKRIFGLDKTELSAKQFTDYEDRFQFFAGAALFLLLIEILISEKRGAWARFFKVDE